MKVMSFDEYNRFSVSEKLDMRGETFKIVAGNKTSGDRKVFVVVDTRDEDIVDCVRKNIDERSIRESDGELRFSIDNSEVMGLITKIRTECDSTEADLFAEELEKQMVDYEDFLRFGKKIKTTLGQIKN